MGFYEERVLPRVIDVALGNAEFRAIRRRVVSAVSGDVLEVGFGSGLNVPHYPTSVRRLLAVDPAVTGRRLAAARVAASAVPVEYIGLDGQSLPLDDASIDHVVVTWTLCTIPDVSRALAEMRRVLRPGGALHFVEHGRSPDAGVARWQDRLTPLQRRLFGGCHLNRPVRHMVESAGFEVSDLENYHVGGPRAVGCMFEGRARPV